MGSTSTPPHVLIIGAGITGLVLAQALRKHGVSFAVYERDPDPLHRGKGWGLTIHWSLGAFLRLLPQHLVDRLPETYVDPDAVAKGENGNFLLFDLRTGETKWKVPPAKRLRVSRERLRRLLMDGIDVQWNKSISSISQTSETAVRCEFSDNSGAEGTLLVGCDGSRSKTRSLLCSLAGNKTPVRSENYQLPVRLIGVSAALPSRVALKMRALDPFFLQAGDPVTSNFFWFSFLDTPTNNDREGRDTYECQILISWPYRKDGSNNIEIPCRNVDKIKLMHSLADGWVEPFREVVQSIPEETEPKIISLEDWPTPPKGSWSNLGGTATLVGDSAHAMTMFRGEAGNHGILDVSNLLEALIPVLTSSPHSPAKTQEEVINEYEDEMATRTRPAVLRSRKACLDAHDYPSITADSPLVARRGAFEDDDLEYLLN
ncbi:FAD binding domain-containing protein [Trichophyton equinum CBS 127.97]|uniref:FAD binding domain-containing protein n=1 Tax=Trichophyton equinum (strain ATCC MYA-4606 / CBS 127.97) TaxID=559882 RepID=F2PKX5_TRIEC|nr:FAD binding domain-containing protein [Trichophyton equinum CBS 127.97]